VKSRTKRHKGDKYEGGGKRRYGSGSRAQSGSFKSALRDIDTVLAEFIGFSDEGEVMARITETKMPGWEVTLPLEVILTGPEVDRHTFRSGEKIIARLNTLDPNEVITASLIKTLKQESSRIVGVIGKSRGGFTLEPTNRKEKRIFRLDSLPEGVGVGDLVVAEVDENNRMRRAQSRSHTNSGGGGNSVNIQKNLGAADDVKNYSLIAIHTHGLPHEFSTAAVDSAAKGKVPPLGKREDLRNLGLVTIDGEDARDFDDAVYAEPDTNPKNKGGWNIVVAIADVSYYVRPESALDVEAEKRGNSVYLPDRVVPMLPENLSNNLCSLRPDEDRACLAAHITINAQGKTLSYRFSRALMKSKARLTYNQVQKAFDEGGGELAEHFPKIKNLYGAYKSLEQERIKRQTLELDLPEFKIKFADDGEVSGVIKRERLESHKLIEEFMILANVAAADALSKAQQGAVYRVHEPPDAMKLMELNEFVQDLGLKGGTRKAAAITPGIFNEILDQAKERADYFLINTFVLRCQTQAYYSPRNLGHFGLSLDRYTHFTSPIRRYSDLIVHRALLKLFKLEEKNEVKGYDSALERVANHISATERLAMQAERDTVDRFIAYFMHTMVGRDFTVVVTGMAGIGLFITIPESGCNGIIPMRMLQGDYFVLDSSGTFMMGVRTRRRIAIGDKMRATLIEARPINGELVFEPVFESGGSYRPASSKAGVKLKKSKVNQSKKRKIRKQR
jgi:ribonuclease R